MSTGVSKGNGVVQIVAGPCGGVVVGVVASFLIACGCLRRLPWLGVLLGTLVGASVDVKVQEEGEIEMDEVESRICCNVGEKLWLIFRWLMKLWRALPTTVGESLLLHSSLSMESSRPMQVTSVVIRTAVL